jgi:WD repeat-containing protein 35
LLFCFLSLASAGHAEDAARVYVHAGQPQAAVDTCVRLNHWALAVSLAETHRVHTINTVLVQYAGHLQRSGKRYQAVDLYRKAGRHAEATRALLALAAEAGREPTATPVEVKKLYVLAGLEGEAWRRTNLTAATRDVAARSPTAAAGGASSTGSGGVGSASSVAAATAQSLEGLLSADDAVATAAGSGGGSGASLDRPWRGAEAYHFWLLAHRQLHQGQAEAAARTAARLSDYDDLVPPDRAEAIAALASYAAARYGSCSRAFVKLESMPTLTAEQKEEYRRVALSIFLLHPPRDPAPSAGGTGELHCPRCRTPVRETDSACEDCGKLLPVCIASGASLLGVPAVTCPHCHHQGAEHLMRSFSNCPLCHQSLAGAVVSALPRG